MSSSDSTSGDAVALHDVTFTYPRGRTVLDIPQLRIATGDRVFLHGPSGCGKSTLLSLIAGVLRPTSGQLEVLGNDFTKLSSSARDRIRGTSIGYIFQSFNLIPYLSVADNIALPCRLHRERLRNIRAASLSDEVQRLATRLDIASFLHDPVRRLSVGQQQRVAIARALIGAPPLLIADEPTSSLDTNRRDDFLALLLELLAEPSSSGRPTTLLYVSHDESLATRFTHHLSLPALNRISTEEGKRHAAA